MDRLISILINEVLNPLIFLLFGLAVLFFMWGIINYVANADDAEKRKIGQRHIAWGIIGIVIMISAFGIIKFFDNSLNQIDPSRATVLETYEVTRVS